MSDILSYNGYIGSVEWSDEDKCFCGEVLGLPVGTMILYEGNSIEELEKDFHDGIDHYLETCKENGIEPKRSCLDAYDLSPEIQVRIADCAKEEGSSINSVIKETLEARFATA